MAEERSKGGSESKLEVSNCEELIEWLNPIGRWQLWIFAWIALAQFFYAAINVAAIFFQLTPPHECVPPLQDTGWSAQSIANIR